MRLALVLMSRRRAPQQRMQLTGGSDEAACAPQRFSVTENIGYTYCFRSKNKNMIRNVFFEIFQTGTKS